MSFKIKFSKTVVALFERLIEAVLNHNPKPRFEGGDLTLDIAPFVSITQKGSNSMATYTIPNDQAPVPYSISPITGAVDAEGEPVAVSEEFVSSNPAVIAINGDVRSGNLGVGTSGVASIDYTAFYMVGRNKVVLKHQDASFIVTTGQVVTPPAGGDLVIEGLTPDPE